MEDVRVPVACPSVKASSLSRFLKPQDSGGGVERRFKHLVLNLGPKSVHQRYCSLVHQEWLLVSRDWLCYRQQGMDKSWMLADRRSKEYDEGVESFLKLGLLHASNPDFILCPCRKCSNLKAHSVKEIREHLYFNGIDQSYRTWIWHGEELPTASSTSRNVQLKRCNLESEEDELGPSGVDPSTRKRMDKSWMFADRRSKEYDEGVENFLKFGVLHASNPNSICCPCRKCENLKNHTVREVREHLFFNGIDQSYSTWIWHGEELPAGTSTSRNLEFETRNSEPEEDDIVPSKVDKRTRKRMDKSWMYADRRSQEYDEGVENFLKFALLNASDPNSIPCPCRKCGSFKNHTVIKIREHLYFNGIDQSYCTWIWHGEELPTGSSTSTNAQSGSGHSEPEDVVGPSKVDRSTKKRKANLHPGSSTSMSVQVESCNSEPEEEEVGASEQEPITRRRKGRVPTTPCHESSTSTNVQFERCNSEPEEDEIGPSEVDPSTKKRKGRGTTLLRQLVSDKRKGKKLIVRFNSKGQPFGKVATQFSSYLGVLGRKMVPVSYATWKKVPPKLKDKIWSSVLMLYEVEGGFKTRVLTSISTRWRTFKNTLTTKFILPFKDQPELLQHPPSMYNFINQTHWDIFVKSRMTEKWMRFSQVQKERRAKYVYNHCLSRKGYAGLEVELQHSTGTGEEIDRSVLWKAGRVNKKGEYVNDAVRERAEKICYFFKDELTRQVEGGELSITGSQDVLSLALETPEHSGRVRGVGHFVTPTAYFGLPKRCSSTEEMKLMKDKVHSLSETVEKLVAEVRSMNDLRQNGQGIMEQDRPGGSLQKGTLTKPNTVSSKKLCAETYKPPTSVKSLLRYAESLMDADGTIEIPSESGVFATKSSYIFLTKDDVMQFCKMEEITVTAIQAYMGKLYDGLEKSKLVPNCIFADPLALSEGSGLKTKRARALAVRMEVVRPGQFMVFPYNALGHWMLVVVDPHNAIVYFLDPTEHEPSQDLENLILIAFKIWAAQLGKKVRKGLSWRKIKCPKKSASAECGYYTMRYMKDIFGSHEHAPITNVFDERDAYTMAEIDEVRSEWALFIWQFVD